MKRIVPFFLARVGLWVITVGCAKSRPEAVPQAKVSLVGQPKRAAPAPHIAPVLKKQEPQRP